MSVFVASLSAIGCAGPSDGSPSPTAPSAEQRAGAGADDNAASPPQSPRPDPPPPAGTCVAEQARWAIGRVGSAALLERARVDATASIARFIHPNEAITMEYYAARLNLYLDGRGVVHAVVCG